MRWCLIVRSLRPIVRQTLSPVPVNNRLLLLGALALSSASVEAQSRPAGPPHGATDVGLAPHLPAAGRACAWGRGEGCARSWGHEPGREAVFGASAMVASDAPLASQAGVEILKKGGN